MAQRTAAFNLFEKYNDDYFSPTLGAAFATVARLKKERHKPKSPIDPEKLKRLIANIRLLESNPNEMPEQDRIETQEINQARRTIKRYYHKIADLYHSGIINKKKVANLCKKDGIYLYLNIVQAIEKKAYPHSSDIYYFELIDKIVYYLDKTKTNNKNEI